MVNFILEAILESNPNTSWKKAVAAPFIAIFFLLAVAPIWGAVSLLLMAADRSGIIKFRLHSDKPAS